MKHDAFAIDLGTYWYRWAVKSAIPEVGTVYSDSAILGSNTTIDTTQAAKDLTGAAVTSLTSTDSIIGKTSTDIPIDYTGVDDPPVDPPVDPPIEEPTSILDALAKLLATIVAIPHLIAEAISTTFTTEKPGDTIDFTKLKFAANLFTNKFPFSLPWDLQAMVTTFGSGTTIAPVIPIGIGNIQTNIDLSRFNSLAAAVRVLELFAFGVGLLFGTRKLLGGAS